MKRNCAAAFPSSGGPNPHELLFAAGALVGKVRKQSLTTCLVGGRYGYYGYSLATCVMRAHSCGDLVRKTVSTLSHHKLWFWGNAIPIYPLKHSETLGISQQLRTPIQIGHGRLLAWHPRPSSSSTMDESMKLLR